MIFVKRRTEIFKNNKANIVVLEPMIDNSYQVCDLLHFIGTRTTSAWDGYFIIFLLFLQILDFTK